MPVVVRDLCGAQVVAIDALCVYESMPEERGSSNGWMHCGVLVGRAAMGGDSLVLEQWIGFPAVVGVLCGLILASAALLAFAHEKPFSGLVDPTQSDAAFTSRLSMMFRELIVAVRSGGIWAGLLFSMTAPAAFKSLKAVIGPFLIDHGYSKT